MKNRTGRITAATEPVVAVDPLDRLTPAERVAYTSIPLARYGESGVATFRQYLLDQARRRTR